MSIRGMGMKGMRADIIITDDIINEGRRYPTKLEEILTAAKRRGFNPIRYAVSYVIANELH